MLDNMSNDIDKREGSFISNMVSPVGVEFAKYYMELDNILAIMFLEDATNEFLDKKVGDFGIYRKLGQSATGFIKVTGTNGTHIPKGTVVLSQGELEFYTIEDAWINEGMATIEVEASDVGEQYNIIPNSIESFGVKIAGDETVTNEETFEGGINIETDEELRLEFIGKSMKKNFIISHGLLLLVFLMNMFTTFNTAKRNWAEFLSNSHRLWNTGLWMWGILILLIDILFCHMKNDQYSIHGCEILCYLNTFIKRFG
jgi:hypothetical protein